MQQTDERGSDAMSVRRLRSGGYMGVGAIVMAALLLTACDLTVTNPGPVQDAFLDDPGAYPAVLNGARRALAMGYTRLAVDGAMISNEAVPGGLFGTDFILGTLTSDNVGDHWTAMQKARWLAENGAERLDAAGASARSEYAGLLLLAGYANRSLGHNMCTAIIDGGTAGDFMQYFTRAEQHFTQVIAEAGASSVAGQAALAGRADVNMWQGDWADAFADAQAVTSNGMVFQLQYYDLDFPDSNEMMFRQASLPWREYTIWSTFMEDYYTTTGDPRMEWRTNPAEPNTMVDNLPFYVQLKFTEFTSPHTLSSGWEMLLVRAEAILRGQGSGDFNDAMTLINQVRTRNVSDVNALPLAPWTAANATEAWVALKQERRIELWGESRRFGDLRRWVTQNAPGATPLEDVSGRSSCFPIGTNEINSNPNLDPSMKVTSANSPRFP